MTGTHTIEIHDDVFPLSVRLNTFNSALNSSFSLLDWTCTSVPERHSHNLSFFSPWSTEYVESLSILASIRNSPASHILENYELTKSILNLTTPSDVYYTHTHPEEKVLLYYVNLEWKEGWHGETQFYSDNLRDIKYTSPYTPGRLILFDGNIPHTMRPKSIIAPKFRFSLSMFLNRK